MTSLPCYEILGLDRNADNSIEAVEDAYYRIKRVQTCDDIESAYQTLRDPKTRAVYNLNMVPFKSCDWNWKDNEDEKGVWRSLVRVSKKERSNIWELSDDRERRDLKKSKMKDRKGNRDKRRGVEGYDD